MRPGKLPAGTAPSSKCGARGRPSADRPWTSSRSWSDRCWVRRAGSTQDGGRTAEPAVHRSTDHRRPRRAVRSCHSTRATALAAACRRKADDRKFARRAQRLGMTPAVIIVSQRIADLDCVATGWLRRARRSDEPSQDAAARFGTRPEATQRPWPRSIHCVGRTVRVHDERVAA